MPFSLFPSGRSSSSSRTFASPTSPTASPDAAGGAALTDGSAPAAAAAAAASPLKVNLGDPSVIKHVLDEHAAQTVCASGYVEDVTFSNAKLLLGSVAVAIAAACNLLPAPYATSAVLLRSSVLAYFALQALLQLMHFALPRHCILITRPRRHIPPDAAAPAAALDPVKRKALLKSSKPSSLAYTSPPLVLTSQLPRYATAYALALGRKEGGPVRVERVMEITEFFDRTGVFLKAKYEAEVQLLIQEVERRETNSRKAAREPSGLKTQ